MKKRSTNLRDHKVVNLADKKEVMELLHELYGDEIKDYKKNATSGETGTTGPGGLAELSSITKKVFSQDE